MRRRNFKRYRMARDSQRSRVYKFERDLAEGSESWGILHRSHRRTYANGTHSEWDSSVPFYISNMTEQECMKFVNKAHRWWYKDTENRLSDVKITFANRDGSCFYLPMENKLLIRTKWGMNKDILLHELTHYIIGRSTRKEFRCEGSHGKIFMRILATLLARFTQHSMTEIKRVAKKNKAKMCGLKDSSGKNIRRKLKAS